MLSFLIGLIYWVHDPSSATYNCVFCHKLFNLSGLCFLNGININT